jgi:hypothetical protein
MKNIKRIFFLLMLISGTGFSQTNSNSKEAIYTCEMHPEIQEKNPGNCPKCGMDLVLDKKSSANKKHQHKVKSVQNTEIPKITEVKLYEPKPAIPVISINEKQERVVRYDLYVRDTMVTQENAPLQMVKSDAP